LIRIFNVYYPVRTLILLAVEAGIVLSSFLLGTWLRFGEDSSLVLNFEGGYYKIFIFTGLFLGIATAVGVAFGGFRVIIKRLFPGKVFDRPQDIEVLQMGLSGKKIDPTDMY